MHPIKLFQCLRFCTFFTVMFTPYWSHVQGYTDQRDLLEDRLLYLKYEDMKTVRNKGLFLVLINAFKLYLQDLASEVNKTSEFLQRPKLSAVNMETFLDHLSFEKMKNNPAVQTGFFMRDVRQLDNNEKVTKFFRCGQVNQWKKEMSPEMSQKFDEWITKNQLN